MISHLDTKNKKQALYITLYETIKKDILNHKYISNSKMPSIRSLANSLNISKNTVLSAYEQLLAEGYIYAKEKSGFFVSDISSQIKTKQSIQKETTQSKKVPEEAQVRYDFRSGQIDHDSFPIIQFKKALSQSLHNENSQILDYGAHQGDVGFREEISKYLYQSRGVLCDKEQIILASGTQQLLQMLSLLIKSHGPSIAFENPGYVGSKEVFEHMGYNIQPIEIDNEGININQLSNTDATITYVTPSHQFPTGVIMPINKRLELLQWAKKKKGLIIEDDYDSEFRFKGQPIPSLHSLDSEEHVIYIGSFSKSLMPSLRISYMVLPPKILDIYYEKYTIYEQSVPRVLQETMTKFMQNNHWSRHLKRMRTLYRKKQEVLIQSLQDTFKDQVKIYGSDAGLHLLVEVNTNASSSQLIDQAAKTGIALNQMSKYYFKKTKNKKPIILIGFAGIPYDQITPAVEQLYTAWFSS